MSLTEAQVGELYLLVTQAGAEPRAYGITIPHRAYAVFDEFIYSCAGHGSNATHHIGGNYLKEARSSQLIAAARYAGLEGDLRQFLFVRMDDCIEVLTCGEPKIKMLNGEAETDAWGPPRS